MSQITLIFESNSCKTSLLCKSTGKTMKSSQILTVTFRTLVTFKVKVDVNETFWKRKKGKNIQFDLL